MVSYEDGGKLVTSVTHAPNTILTKVAHYRVRA